MRRLFGGEQLSDRGHQSVDPLSETPIGLVDPLSETAIRLPRFLGQPRDGVVGICNFQRQIGHFQRQVTNLPLRIPPDLAVLFPILPPLFGKTRRDMLDALKAFFDRHCVSLGGYAD